MAKKYYTCIECPKGCRLEIDIEGETVVKVTGQQCAKGEDYAKQESINPLRTLTTTIIAEGLDLKFVPVRTTHPIPKARLTEAIEATRKIRLSKTVQVGEVIMSNILGLGIDLVATRGATRP